MLHVNTQSIYFIHYLLHIVKGLNDKNTLEVCIAFYFCKYLYITTIQF
jgi:hypothetical protein